MNPSNGALHPLMKFFGVDPAQGAWAVLGLDEGDVGSEEGRRREAVLAALDRRMEQVRSHPDGASADGQRAVDAVRSAAGEVLSAVVRGAAGGAGGVGAAGGARGLDAAGAAELSRDVALAMAQFGGWNRRSMRRLAMLAARRGVDGSVIAGIVRGLSGGLAGGGAVGASGAGVARTGLVQREVVGGPAAGASVAAAPVMAAPAMPAAAKPASFGPAVGARVPAVGGAPGAGVMMPQPVREMPRPGSSIFATPANAPTPDQVDPARKLVLVALAVVGGVLFLLIAAGVVVTLVLQAPSGGGAGVGGAGGGEVVNDANGVKPVEGEGSSGGGAEVTEPVRTIPKLSPITAASLAEAEPGAILRAITTSVDALDLDAGVASASFEEAARAASTAWPRFAPDQIAAMQESIVEFVYRSASAGEASAAAVVVCLENLDELTAGSGVDGAVAGGRIAPAMFSAGIATRLLGEREMPSLAQGALRRALPPGGVISLTAGPFGQGALAAATALAGQMAVRSPLKEEAWRAWSAAVEPLVKADEAMSSRMRLLALDALLVGPPDTQRDASLSKVIALLVQGTQWRENDESRRWLVRWLDSARVSPAGLSAVMNALIDQSSAAHIDVTMRLSPAASAGQRAELRERIAKLWGVGDAADRGETFKSWVEAVDRVLPMSEDGSLRKFAHAAVLSRLSEAAELLGAGDSTGAATILGDLEGPVASALGRRTLPVTELGADEGDWIARYAAAEKTVAPRLALLAQVVGERVPAATAEVVVGEALRSANGQVRDAAKEIVRRHINTIEFVNALLEQLPTMARANENAELVREAVSDSLPPVRDISWRAAARRALVARMLDLLSVDAESAGMAAVAEVLAESYRARVSALPGSEATGQVSIAELAAMLRAQWRERAVAGAPGGLQPALITQLDGKHESRSALAKGLVQRFAAAQVGAAEMMGAAVRSEHPAEAAKVDLILQELTQERRRATDAMQQVDACEAAMLRLWALRLGGGGA